MLSEKKQNYILEGIPKIAGLFTLRDVPIIPYMLNLVGGLSSLRPCDQGTSGSTVVRRFNRYSTQIEFPCSTKKILARIMLPWVPEAFHARFPVLGGYVPPGTPNWHPVLKTISPKIDTPC